MATDMSTGGDTDRWGSDLTIVTVSSFEYLPGVYALFNSALLNGFEGCVRLYVHPNVDPGLVVQHPRLSVEELPRLFEGTYSLYTQRLAALASLKDGRYLYLDSDVIVERPCGHLLEPIAAGVLVSPEPESKYSAHDAIVYEQCKVSGVKPDELEEFPYVNAGLLGFELPRDRDLIQQFFELSRDHLAGTTRVFENPVFPFLDQDILNLLLRKRCHEGKAVFSISPKVLEFSNFSQLFRDRPFPHTRQGELKPADQIKYIIHGASLRRPWLRPDRQDALRTRLVYSLEPLGVRILLGRPLPYERAWAYYACADGLPVPVSAWAGRHGFTFHRSWFWRKAYGLPG